MEENLEMKLKQVISDHIHGVDTPPTIFRALMRRYKGAELNFSRDEMLWLQYSMDFLKKVVENNVASGLFYLLREKLMSSNIRNLAARLGKYDRAIRYWLSKFEEYELVIGRRGEDKRELRYLMNPNLDNLTKLLSEIIIEYHGKKKIKKLVNKKNPKSYKADKRAIRKYRSKKKGYI